MSETKKSSITKRSTVYLLNVKQPDQVNKRIKLSFQRTRATISVLKTDTAVTASMGLVDLTEAGAGFFTEQLLLKGAVVEVSITEPRILKIKGVVAWSIPVQSGVHSSRFPFRTGVQFVYDNETQKVALQEFIQRVNTDPMEALKSPAPSGPAAGLEPPATPADASGAPAAEGGTPAAATPAPESTAPATEASPAPETPVPAAEAAPAAAEAAPAPAASDTSGGDTGGQSQAA